MLSLWVFFFFFYLGLKGALQRAEGPGRRDDRGKARHGRWVGVEELKKKRGRG